MRSKLKDKNMLYIVCSLLVIILSTLTMQITPIIKIAHLVLAILILVVNLFNNKHTELISFISYALIILTYLMKGV